MTMTNEADPALIALDRELIEKSAILAKLRRRRVVLHEELTTNQDKIGKFERDVARLEEALKLLKPIVIESVPKIGADQKKCLIVIRKNGMDWQCILDKGHTQGHDFRRYGAKCSNTWTDSALNVEFKCIRDRGHRGLCDYSQGDDLKDDL